VSEPVPIRVAPAEQFLQRSLVSAAPVAEQLGDSCRVDEGVVIRLLDAANSNTIERFLQYGQRAIKKNGQSWRVSGGLSALSHEPAETTKAGKPNRKQTSTRKTYAN